MYISTYIYLFVYLNIYYIGTRTDARHNQASLIVPSAKYIMNNFSYILQNYIYLMTINCDTFICLDG